MKFPPEEPKTSFTINEVDASFESWIDKSFLSENTRKRLLLANVLLVPAQGHAGEDVWYFPNGTIDLYDFLNRNKTEDLIIEACIEDKDYKELSLHSDLLILAGFVVVNLVAPVIVNLVSNYISEKLGNRKENSLIKSKLTVILEDDRRSVELDYYGPAKDYNDLMIDTLSKLNSLPSKETPTLLASNQPTILNITPETIKQPKKKKKKKRKR